ncbi:MAG: peptidylprolyl isomerase, partial [Candidatus Omnitrophica bacterium]|nr:peptidylprolyl isomerase [Candidatus Omnitrophota bacterium]
MLIWMRERKRQLVKWFVWPLIFVFIALYGSAQIQNQIAIDKLTVLKVNGARIPQRDFQAAVEEMGRRLQDSVIRPEKSQSRLALEQLIQNELARQLAEDLRLRTDDSKLRQSLNYYLTGGRGGPINEQGLIRFVREQGFETLDLFREHMRGQMNVGLAMDYVASTAAPSEKDLQRAMQRQRETRVVEALLFELEPHREQVRAATEEVQAYFQKNIERYRFPKRMKIDYVEDKPEDYVQSATFTEENLTRWFNSNKEKFLVPVERDVAALAFSAKDFRERVTLTEEEVRTAFDSEQSGFMHPEKYRIRFLAASVEPPDASIEAEIAKNPADFVAKQEAVGARHILLRIPPDATPRDTEEIRGKLEAIRARIRTEADFIREAAENSDDVSNKFEGGDLGYFDKTRMVPEFADVAFSISEATVSAPVKTAFGYHLIWVYNKRPAGERLSLDEARIVLTGKIDEAPLKEAARKKLESIRTALAGKPLSAATAVTEAPVYESDLFARGDTPHPEAARDRYAFAPACAKMTVGASPEIVEAFYRFYLVELIEKQEPRPKTFEEARPDVERTLRNRKALELARTQARNAAALVRSGSLEFSAIPKAYGIPEPVTHTDLREPSTQMPQLPKNQSVPREIL